MASERELDDLPVAELEGVQGGKELPPLADRPELWRELHQTYFQNLRQQQPKPLPIKKPLEQ